MTFEHAPYRFAVKANANQGFTIYLEPVEDARRLSILSRGFMALEMHDDKDLEGIKALARMLNERVEFVTYAG